MTGTAITRLRRRTAGAALAAGIAVGVVGFISPSGADPVTEGPSRCRAEAPHSSYSAGPGPILRDGRVRMSCT